MGLDRTEIAAQLRDDITAGTYPAHAKLPSYRELATKFGAAPNTIGEAVRQLADEGLIRIKRNSRAIVLSPAEAADPEEPPVNVREELTQVQADLRDSRAQLTSLERRVSELINRLPSD